MKPAAFVLALGVTVTPHQSSAEVFGKCRFDLATISFQGTPEQQAGCLLRKVKILGVVDPTPIVLPANLSRLVGKDTDISKDKLRRYITSGGLTEDGVGGKLSDPLSRGRDNSPDAPAARYFVIHDTSYPVYRRLPFPGDIDTNDFVNDLSIWQRPDNRVAHAFINRLGEIYIGHKFNVPWRATRLETRSVGRPSKGMFLHVENVQPRAPHPSQDDGNAPSPGFSKKQYERLALLYVVASARAGKGLIPAFHAAVDEGISGSHDDPQNFDLAEFDSAIGKIMDVVAR